MITLSNGHSFTFCCASGALGFDGDGYPWEWPLRWLGVLRPHEFTIITKTVTDQPRSGNLRWWCPWRCVRLIKGGTVNAVGLTNIGIDRWLEQCLPTVSKRGYDTILSVQPENLHEAVRMGQLIYRHRHDLRGVEVNISCPNVGHDLKTGEAIAIVRAISETCGLPVGVKLGHQQLWLIEQLEADVEFFDIINAVPWNDTVLSDNGNKSPLSKYGLVGAISGSLITGIARDALKLAVTKTKRQLIAGGGIADVDEVLYREALGASGFSLGVVFLRKPWLPNRIVKQYNNLRKARQCCNSARTSRN